GEKKFELSNLIKDNNASDYIKFVGFRNEDKIPYFINKASLTVIPSVYEPFGIAAVESLACGTPVIVPSSSGLAEIVDQEKCWTSFNGSIEDLKHKIETFNCDSPNLLSQSNNIASKYFNVINSNKKLILLYKKYALLF